MPSSLAPLLAAAVATATATPAPMPPPLAAATAQFERDWAKANYATPKEQQAAAFDALLAKARALQARFPARAEPLVWAGVAQVYKAGVVGGMAGFGLVKAARRDLEAAETIDPAAAGGLGLIELGTLYYQVPGFPIAFGDRGKASRYLQRALALDPSGLAANLAYGDFLVSGGNFDRATAVLRRALAAPPRPGQDAAERGRRAEVAALLAKAAARRR